MARIRCTKLVERLVKCWNFDRAGFPADCRTKVGSLAKKMYPALVLLVFRAYRPVTLMMCGVWFYQNDHKEQLCTPQAITVLTRLKRIESKIAREVAQNTSKTQNISYTQNTSKTQILL